MKPYYQDDLVTIYHADSREVLANMEPASIDLVLTDPPYGISYVSHSRKKGDPLRVPIANDEDLNAVRDVMPLLDRALHNDRHAYLFSSPSRIGEEANLVSLFWKVKNLLVWYKGEMGRTGDLVAGYGVNWEGIIYASKGRRALNGPRPLCVIRHDWSGARDPVHPTVKPVGLLTTLVAKSSNEGELVVDPFMGSGTTLKAAKSLKRRAIGIELEERYCEVAAKRVSAST